MTREAIVPAGSETSYQRFHFAPAFRVGDTIYISGVIGRGPDGSVPAVAADEFAAVFAELGSVLAASGCTFADIVDITSFHTDMPATLGTFMKIKDTVIAEPYPAWTAIGCTALAVLGARVEVKVVAVKR
jgi:enamine deaminase RidA (YjgF/YER057c/UK114 family)